MAENTNLKLILNDILSISKGTWNKVKDVQIKSFAESDTISGSVSTSGVLNLGVKISNFVSNDITNALTVKSGADPGLYVGLPVSSDGKSYGLIKAGNGVKIENGELSVNLSENLIVENDDYIEAKTSGNVISIKSKNIGENTEATNYLTNETVVWDGLHALDSAIGLVSGLVNSIKIPEVPEYSITKLKTPQDGYAASYQLTKGGVGVGDPINIIKDQFLNNVELIASAPANDDEYGIVQGKSYIKFSFNVSSGYGTETSGKIIYLDASELVNVDELTQVIKVNSIASFNADDYNLTRDALIFTAEGETGIYDAASDTVRDCSEETIDTITDSTNASLIPNVGAIKTYLNTVKSSFGSADIKYVDEIPSSYVSDKNILFFTASGETGIYDAENNMMRDISDETISVITDTTNPNCLPTVGALTGYVDSLNDDLVDLRTEFEKLKALITSSN